MIIDLLRLLFPNYCLLCDEPLIHTEKEICLTCNYSLPKYDFNYYREKAKNLFYGITVCDVFSLLMFQKGNATQKLISAFKYKGVKGVGDLAGALMAAEILRMTPDFTRPDLIVPIPLHKKKKRLRGYNQSEIFGNSLSMHLGIPADCKLVRRNKYSSSQTNKSRFTRWQNVENQFSIIKQVPKEIKHIMIVDDVLTTGATIQSVATVLMNSGIETVSVATIAITTK